LEVGNKKKRPRVEPRRKNSTPLKRGEGRHTKQPAAPFGKGKPLKRERD